MNLSWFDDIFFCYQNRMWRKTRKPYGRCYGADPNRNFDFHHGGLTISATIFQYWQLISGFFLAIISFAETGSSNNPCSETYAGPKAFSESETLSLSEFTKTFPNLRLYIAFHSYSQLLMFPYVSEHFFFVFFPSMKWIGLWYFVWFQGHANEHATNHADLVRYLP